MTRKAILGLFAIALLVAGVSWAEPPIPEPKVVKPIGDVIASPHGQAVKAALGPAGKVLEVGACTGESKYEVRPSGNYYGSECRRLRVVFGPIWNKPGQDDVLIQPVTFEKPLYDGYITRFKPNAVDAQGVTPPVEIMHLHHGTWLNVYPSYGNGPFFASGEEKTISPWPYRYGMRIGAMDTWLFLHMVHNATPQTFPIFVTYDLDYIAKEDAEKPQPDGKPLITASRPIWLDAGGSNFHEKTETYLLNPIFNIQRGFGTPVTDAVGRPTKGCRFPDKECAGFNSNGNKSAQQGINVDAEVPGWEYTITDETLGGYKQCRGTDGICRGTLITMGGHVHNGGLRTEVELVRNGVAKMINISEAYYWQDEPHTDRIGAAPVSWDYSMTGHSLDLGWAVNVEEGDKLRLNGVYDTAAGSWYEQMAIVMSWVVPGGIPEGKDIFNGATTNEGIPTTAAVPNGPDGAPLAKTCTPSATVLCLRGQITHGQIGSSGNHGSTFQPFDWTKVKNGQHLNDVLIGGFTYGLTDQGVASTVGVPFVKLGETISFHNLDTAAYMWHTITRCEAPCNGPTTVDYPIPDAGSMLPGFDPMDFDSTQLGIGTGPTQRVSWTFTPTQKGTFTFFCRVHPPMRGVFRVT